MEIPKETITALGKHAIEVFSMIDKLIDHYNSCNASISSIAVNAKDYDAVNKKLNPAYDFSRNKYRGYNITRS